VLGTIAIVFGLCGALQGLCGVASVFAMGPITQMLGKFTPATAGGPTLESTLAVTQKFAAWAIASNIFAVLVAVLLIVGGARLIKRRAKCRGTILLWGGLKFLVAVVAVVLGYLSMQEHASLASGPSAPGSAMMQGVAMFSLAFSFLWLLALPVFMVVWFSRPRIRDEVAGWN